LFACAFFNPSDHKCGIYDVRPLDCSIYPVIVTREKNGRRVLMGVDTKCPALTRPEIAKRVTGHLQAVQRVLETPEVAVVLQAHPEFISEYQEEARELRELSLERV